MATASLDYANFQYGNDRIRIAARGLPQIARDRLLRHPESLGPRHSALPAPSWLPGPRHTTSAGFAFSRGLPDSDRAVPRDMALRHFAEIASAVDLPVNADFASGYAIEPEGVAESVRLCIETGVAGLSIEDSTGDPEHPLFDLPVSIDRFKAARRAIDASDSGVLLTARAECYLVGHPEPLKESLHRLQCYAEAGADVLYAPGPRASSDIEATVAAVSPKPVNILMSSNTGLKVADLAAMGVRRISVGSSLARAAWSAFIRAATAIAQQGSFEGFDNLAASQELNSLFRI
jgi:2-methylisocitrate lyase-like PEP mutase family enzyme